MRAIKEQMEVVGWPQRLEAAKNLVPVDKVRIFHFCVDFNVEVAKAILRTRTIECHELVKGCCSGARAPKKLVAWYLQGKVIECKFSVGFGGQLEKSTTTKDTVSTNNGGLSLWREPQRLKAVPGEEDGRSRLMLSKRSLWE